MGRDLKKFENHCSKLLQKRFQILDIPDFNPSNDDELRELNGIAQQLKHDILREQKRATKEQRTAESSPIKSRKVERLQKKLTEVEAKMVLAAPDLPLRIYHMQGKVSSWICVVVARGGASVQHI